jgi:hypothetical protein
LRENEGKWGNEGSYWGIIKGNCAKRRFDQRHAFFVAVFHF